MIMGQPLDDEERRRRGHRGSRTITSRFTIIMLIAAIVGVLLLLTQPAHGDSDVVGEGMMTPPTNDGGQEGGAQQVEGEDYQPRQLTLVTHKALLRQIRELANASEAQAIQILTQLNTTEINIITTFNDDSAHLQALILEAQRKIETDLHVTEVDVITRIEEAEEDIVHSVDDAAERVLQQLECDSNLLRDRVTSSTELISTTILTTTSELKGELLQDIDNAVIGLTSQIESVNTHLSDVLDSTTSLLLNDISDTTTTVEKTLELTQHEVLADIHLSTEELSNEVLRLQEQLTHTVSLTETSLANQFNLGQNELALRFGFTGDLLNQQLSSQRNDLSLNLLRTELALSQDIRQSSESCSREVGDSTSQLLSSVDGLRSDVLSEVSRISTQNQLIRSELAFIEAQTAVASLLSRTGFILNGSFGIEYLGAGYDIFKGNPRGDLQGSPDPGYRAQAVQLVFLEDPLLGDCPNGLNLCPQGVSVRGTPECNYDSSMQEEASKDDFQLDLALELNVEASVNIPLPIVEPLSAYFSLSLGAQYFEDRSTQLRLTSFIKKIFCRTYRAEFQPGYVPIPTAGLVRAIQNLPSTYNYTDYLRFIQDWGTHYVFNVEMGGRYYSETLMRSSEVTKLTRLGIDTKLTMGLQKRGIPIPGLSAIPNFDLSFTTKTGITQDDYFAQSSYGSRAYNMGGDAPLDFDLDVWAASVPRKPQPVKASVRSLYEFFIDKNKGLNFLRAQQAYLKDERQKPIDKLNTRNERQSYNGDARLRFGSVYAVADEPPESLSSAPFTGALDLRWQVGNWPRVDGGNNAVTTGGHYRVGYDKNLPDGATLMTTLNAPPYQLNALPTFDVTSAPFTGQTIPIVAGQDPTGFVVKMTRKGAFVDIQPNHFSFIAAATNIDDQNRGIIAGAVTSDGIKVFQGYGTDTHFESFSWGTDGIYTLKLDNPGIRPLVVATPFLEVTQIIDPFTPTPPAQPTPPTPDAKAPFDRGSVFISEIIEDCKPDCDLTQSAADGCKPFCNDSSLVSIRTMRGLFRTWIAEGSPFPPPPAVIPAGTSINYAFNFMAIGPPGYKGPNNEITWGGIRYFSISSLAAPSTDPPVLFRVTGARLYNSLIDLPIPPQVDVSNVATDAIADVEWGAWLYVSNTGSGDWVPGSGAAPWGEYRRGKGCVPSANVRCPKYFYGIRIRLQGKRYLDTPGIVVTPVLDKFNDVFDTPIEVQDVPRFPNSAGVVHGAGSGGVVCSADWNDSQDEAGGQSIIVTCFDQLAAQPYSTYPNSGRYTIIGFNFIIAGPREK